MPRIPTILVAKGTSAKVQPVVQSSTALSKEQTTDRQVNQAQRNVRAAIAPAASVPDADGNLVKNVSFTSGTNVVISHGLGKAFAGYRVQNVQGGFASFMLVAQSPATLNARTITLQSNGTCTADVWVHA